MGTSGCRHDGTAAWFKIVREKSLARTKTDLLMLLLRLITRENLFSDIITLTDIRANDKTVTLVVCEIIPDPVCEDKQLVAKTYEKGNMNE
jgi:hypothetical protein